MGNRPKAMRVSDDIIGQALQATGGFISLAAQRVGCSTRTVERRIAASAKLRAQLEEICEKKLDLAESSLMKLIKDGNLGAICFYLKCKGKHRGYIERQELAVSVDQSSMDNVSDAELERIVNEHEQTGGVGRAGQKVIEAEVVGLPEVVLVDATPAGGGEAHAGDMRAVDAGG